MSFYNNSNIPNFYFPILLIKIIYLHNKIYFFFFLFFQFSPPPSLNLYHHASTAQSPPPRLHHAHCSLPIKIPSEQKPILKKKTHYDPHWKKRKTQTSSTKHNQDLTDQAWTTRHHLKSPLTSSSPPFFLVQTQSDLIASHHTHPWNPENPFLKPTPTNPPLRKPIPQTHSDEPINRSQPTTMPKSNH